MFMYASTFNQDLSKWDVSNLTNTQLTFSRAAEFNSDIGNWDVDNVQDMNHMFVQALA